MQAIRTKRLFLRDFEPEDFEAFYATSNDPEYQTFYSQEETTRGFWRSIFDKFLIAINTPDRNIFQLAICLSDGELIGTCGIRIEDREHQQASFGCAIARAHWGLGYASEASQAIIDYGFSSLLIQRIYAETISENTKARSLAERLGMRLEGELEHTKYFRGRWWDTAIYAVLKDNWEAIAPN